MPPFFRTLVYFMIGLAVVGLLWEAAAWVIDTPTRLPAMSVVLRKALALAPSPDYMRHATESGTALLYGLLPALIGGVLLGVMTSGSPAIRWLIGPLAVTLGGAPLVALLPIFVSWWGLTIVMKSVTVAVVAGFPAMNATMVAAEEKSRTVAILSGLRVGVVLGVTALVIIEFAAASRGVGFFIMSSANLFDTTATMAGIVLVVLPTIVVAALLQAIEVQLGD